MELEIRLADPIDFDGDALVIPTNSYGLMTDGLAARVKEAAGDTVEEEATRSAPIAVGAAVVTGGGSLNVSHVIHVPVMEQTGMRIGIESVRRATRAALLAANHYQLDRICIPGFGHGEDGIPYDETARAIIGEIRAFRGAHPTGIYLWDLDEEMAHAFRHQLEDR